MKNSQKWEFIKKALIAKYPTKTEEIEEYLLDTFDSPVWASVCKTEAHAADWVADFEIYINF